MLPAHRDGVHVAGVPGAGFVAAQQGLGGGPVQRVVEDVIRLRDAALHDAPPALVVVVVHEARSGVVDERGGGGADVADVRARLLPRRAVVLSFPMWFPFVGLTAVFVGLTAVYCSTVTGAKPLFHLFQHKNTTAPLILLGAVDFRCQKPGIIQRISVLFMPSI